MPTKKTTKNDNVIVDNIEETSEVAETVATKKSKRQINDTDKVAISNNRNWNLDFVSAETDRDITIPANVKHWKKLTVGEIEKQIQLDNGFFVGIDGKGNNAAIEIEDEEIRNYVFHFENNEGENVILLNAKNVKQLLDIENKAEYERKLKELVVTKSDKKMIIPLALEVGIDDVASYKIALIEKISGYKFS